MGQIKQQTIKGSIYSYLGVLLGFAISGILLPRLLTPAEVGLTNLLVSYSIIFAQFATLGFNNATGRLFAYFRNSNKNHHGFFLLSTLILLAGFAITMILFCIFKDSIVRLNAENAELFIEYIGFLIPLTFFTLLFLMLDTYLKMLFSAVEGIFYKELIQRVLILLSIAAFYFEYLTFRQFITAYVVANCLPGIFLLLTVIARREVSLKANWQFIDKKMRKDLVSMSLYGIIIGFSGIAVLNIDKVIVSSMVGIEANGIYAICFFFATLIIIPARSLRKIANTILADAWRDGDMKIIDAVYKKSSITQMIFGTLIFVGLWGNIENVFRILPPEYEAGKYVIFFLGLTNLIEMTSGVSTILLNTSAQYRLTGYLNLLLVLLVVTLSIMFVGIFGLVGAAIASTVSFIVFNILRYYFIYKKFRIQPFSTNHIWVIVLGAATYAVSLLLPLHSNMFLDILLRSTIITSVFGVGVYLLKLSEDVNILVIEIVEKYIKKPKV